MNRDLFFDAMEYIDDDLIETVDALRSRKKPSVNRTWIRWASAAACVCIVLGGVFAASRFIDLKMYSESDGADNETAMDGASGLSGVGDTFHYFTNEEQYVRTGCQHENAALPIVTLIRSENELAAYYEAHRDCCALDASEFSDACKRCDAAFFERYDLLLVILEEESGFIRHNFLGMNEIADGEFRLSIRRIIPEVVTCDTVGWHLFAGITKGCMASGDRVDVSFQNKMKDEVSE